LHCVRVEHNTDTSTTFVFSDSEARELIRVPTAHLGNEALQHATQHTSPNRRSDAQDASQAQPLVGPPHTLATLEASPAFHHSLVPQQHHHAPGGAAQVQEGGSALAERVRQQGGGGVGALGQHHGIKSVAVEVPCAAPQPDRLLDNGSPGSGGDKARFYLK